MPLVPEVPPVVSFSFLDFFFFGCSVPLVPGAPLVPEVPDLSAPMGAPPEVPELAPGLVGDAPEEEAPGLPALDEPDEVSLAPDVADGLSFELLACADWGDALPCAPAEESVPALIPAPCASAIDDADATRTNDND